MWASFATILFVDWLLCILKVKHFWKSLIHTTLPPIFFRKQVPEKHGINFFILIVHCLTPTVHQISSDILIHSNIFSQMTTEQEEAKSNKHRVTMVGWTYDDQYVLTAISDFSIKIWDRLAGKLVHVLQVHV